MSNLQSFFEKIRGDIDHIKKEIASGNLDALSSTSEWYLFFFHPEMKEFRNYHIEKLPAAEVFIMNDPDSVCERPLIDKLLERGNPKGCFQNAIMGCKALKADYVEGYIMSVHMPFPVKHAWNATEKGYLDLTGEGQDRFDWTTVNLLPTFGKDSKPFRETNVYISLDRWTASEAIRDWRKIPNAVKAMCAGSLSLANWLSSNVQTPSRASKKILKEKKRKVGRKPQ